MDWISVESFRKLTFVGSFTAGEPMLGFSQPARSAQCTAWNADIEQHWRTVGVGMTRAS